MLALEEERFLEKIDILPMDIKTKLVDKLLKSITPTPTSIDDVWIDESKNRKEQIESGAVIPIDGNEVFQKIKRRLEL